MTDDDLGSPIHDVDDLCSSLYSDRRIVEGAVLETDAIRIACHGGAEYDPSKRGDGIHGIDRGSLIGGGDVGAAGARHEVVGDDVPSPIGDTAIRRRLRLGTLVEQGIVPSQWDLDVALDQDVAWREVRLEGRIWEGLFVRSPRLRRNLTAGGAGAGKEREEYQEFHGA